MTYMYGTPTILKEGARGGTTGSPTLNEREASVKR